MFQKNPEKLEAKALDYERRGKTAKALKYREKASRLRSGGLPAAGRVYTQTTPSAFTQTTPTAFGQQGSQFTPVRTADRYEQNALKWEQRGNWSKAQKNREKVWRLQNPQHGPEYASPSFYDGQNKFLGYSVPHRGLQQPGLQKQGFQQQGFQQQGGLQQQGFQQQGFQQQGFQQQGFQQQGATIHHTMPATIETHTHATVIEQTMRPERIVEVQPIIHREVDAPEVHIIEQHRYEQVRSTGPNTRTNAAIIEETVRPRIIEEIQPVVHREVPAPFIEHIEQHVTEHIVQPTTMTKEILNDPTVRAPGFAAGGPVQPLQQGGFQQGGFQQGGFQQGGFQQGGFQQGGLQQGGLQQGGQQGTQQGRPQQSTQRR